MFIDPSGDTLFFSRRADGHDTLFVMQPDGRSADAPLALFGTPEQLRAWATPGGAMAVAAPWPVAPGGLRFRVYAMDRVRALLTRGTGDVNTLLTDVPVLGDFTPEPQPLPEPVFARLRGEVLIAPGLGPAGDGRAPALYVMDGRTATSRIIYLAFLGKHSLPAALYDEPASTRRWLTVADSHHLFVLDGPELNLAGDLIWDAEHRGLARLAFHPAAPETWVTAAGRLLVVDRRNLRTVAEISIEDQPRWHRGERSIAAAGAVAFSRDGLTAWVARPYSGDVLEFDTRTRKLRQQIPMAVDPHELLAVPGRILVQGLRNGAISWFPAQT